MLKEVRMNTLQENTFDIHLASDVISPSLEKRMTALGFQKDDFIGGTTGVVHPCHYSFHPSSRRRMQEAWKTATALLRQTDKEEFFGYAEAEVTPSHFRQLFLQKSFDPSITPPFSPFQYESCPIGQHKDLDVHISVSLSNVDLRFRAVMESKLQFHYVDIRKPGDKVVRVYTFQPLGLKAAPKLYHSLVDYLGRAGGFEGKIKLESTFAFERFPVSAPVCPVVTQMPTFVRDLL